MKRLAIIASRGSLNSLVQIATLLMAAVGSGIAVRVFFRDEAMAALMRDGHRPLRLSDVYDGREAEVRARLAAQGLDDVPRLLREVRELGDVRLYACSSSMAIVGVNAADLIDGVEVRGLTAFLLEDIAVSDEVLTF